MSAQEKEFKARLETTKQEIVDVNAKVLALAQAEENAISTGDGAAAIKSKHDAKALQERLEDLTILKAALEAKVRICKANEVKAEIVRGEINTAWNQMAPFLDTIIKSQESVKQAYGEITKIQGQIGSLARKHSELVPESFEAPILRLPREVQYFPSIPLSPLAAWKFVSESERTAEREKEHEKQAPRVKLAIDHAPTCKKCKQSMTLRGDVDGLRERGGSGSGIWSFYCKKCRFVTRQYVRETDYSKLRSKAILIEPEAEAQA